MGAARPSSKGRATPKGAAVPDSLASSTAHWRKSSFSDGGNGCVEVARNLPGFVAVRDSKDPRGQS
ncbi:DUF397 domain-containing protein [Streptosporangium sp. NPDC051023]|uniref:DUF397 domain-containing protein n=1 Tax=Streptosporangium sp. NPDC051023 TaxID=3155410 RepID=UPI00344E2A03